MTLGINVTEHRKSIPCMMLIVVKVSVAFYLVMLNVIKLFVVMLSVVAPCRPRMLQKYGSENEERRF